MMNQLRGVGYTFLKLTKNFQGGALVLALGLALGTTKALAQATDTWIANSGLFDTSANWDTAQIPQGGDTVLFTNNNSFTVSFNGFSALLQDCIFSDHVGSVSLNMGANILYATNRVIIARYDATSTVYVVSGTLYNSFGVAGVGTAQLRIGDTVTNLSGLFPVGTLAVTGGVVYADIVNVGASSNAVGSLVISGPGSMTYDDGTFPNGGGVPAGGTLTVGNGAAFCSLYVTNGGKLFVGGSIIIGNNAPGSNNFALVSGPTTIVTNVTGGGLRVGSGGNNNTMIISNGAVVLSDNGGTIGSNCNGNKMIVTGSGTRLVGGSATNKNFIVGTNSSGSTNNDLTIMDGAFLDSGGTLSFGNNIGSNNTIHIGGPGLMSTGFTVVVRNNSTATYNSMFVSNALFRASLVALQGITNSVSILQNGTVQLANQYAVSPTTTNVVTINTIGSTMLINGGTLSAVSGTNALAVQFSNNNSLLVTNGGKILTEIATFGNAGSLGAGYATGIVSGVSSVWSNWTASVNPVTGNPQTNNFTVGSGGSSNNYFAILNGARFFNNGSLNIGANVTSAFNRVDFGGPGFAVTVVNGGSLNIGSTSNSMGQVLTITNASVTTVNINVGNSGATNNTLVLKGGTLSAGFMRVRPTNTVTFSGGVLSVASNTVDSFSDNNGPFAVGDGTTASAAVCEMAGTSSAVHNFNNGGLLINNNATLRGSGIIIGTVTNLGIFSPGIGAAVGTILFSNNLVFGASAVLNYHLGTLQDSVAVSNNLTLGGTVNVADSGGFGANTYVLFTYSNLVAAGTLTVGTLPAGFTAIVSTNTIPLVQLIVSPSGGGGPSYDTWATHYFTGSALSSNSAADPLGKGMSNNNQFLAGFNPTNAAAFLHITAISRINSGTDIRVDYLGANGDSTYTGGPGSRTNVLEFTTGSGGSYNSNSFVSANVTNVLSGGTGLGTLTNMVDPGGAIASPARYYRVRVLVP